MNFTSIQEKTKKILHTSGIDAPKKHVSNMVECLCFLARVRPNDTALITVTTDDDNHFSYQELAQKVQALAATLQQQFSVGERALIVHDNDEHYVVSFLACLFSGLIAVPVFPPESMREKHLARLFSISKDAAPTCLLTTTHFLTLFDESVPTLSKINAIAVDNIDTDLASQWQKFNPNSEDIAFLQYTSGSTAAPKGVMVSHANLIANGISAQNGFAATQSDITVSWLPLYHDMGLMGGLLQPLLVGIPVVLMSPTFFLQKPVRWLETIARYRGTISGGPDFAYRLCMERIKPSLLQALDLSCWRVAFSGAEPIRHDTLDLFAEKLQCTGFSSNALFPCYGLAEATLYVSGSTAGQGMVTSSFCADALAKNTIEIHDGGKRLVACGTAEKHHQILITEESNHGEFTYLPDQRIGEIWVSGPSVTLGYWQNSQATDTTFVEYNNQRWLRTGDLGFQFQHQLYITGRVKDLIILRGYNVYPQDIESTIESECDFVRKGRIAAFAVTKPDGTEGIGLAMEIPVRLKKSMPVDTLFEKLALVIANLCQESLAVAILLNRGALPKTSSGKLQRSACRNAWQENTLDSYAVYQFGEVISDEKINSADAPVVSIDNELQQQIAELWCEVLEKPTLTLSPHSNFFMLGGNSLLGLRLLAALEQQFDIHIPPADFMKAPTIMALADLVELTLIQEIEQADI